MTTLTQYSRKVLVALLALLMLSSTAVAALEAQWSASPSGEETGYELLYEQILSGEADWIAGLPFGSGAIPTYSAPLPNYNGGYKVIPYFSNLGLLGLLEQPGYEDVVLGYMNWYFTHLNREASELVPAGSIFDYNVAADRQTAQATGDFDSTDSYASTFLNVLRKYAEATDDYAYLLAHEADIRLIADAMLSTLQADGLTWAKPGYRVKYLMDNSEVYIGLVDMQWIADEVFGDAVSAAHYGLLAEQVKGAIQTELWLEGRGAYSHGKMEDGSLLQPDWNSFYADATAQLFPIWTGVLSPEDPLAITLYNRFNEHHPGWPQLDKGDAFPWALIAYTASIMGDRARVDQFLQTVTATYTEQEHPWPWYVMESGVTMLTAANMLRTEAQQQNWEMYSLQNGEELAALPYTITGDSEGVHAVSLQFTHELTGVSREFTVPDLSGSWSIAVDGLVNGTYRVHAVVTDRFNNVYAVEERQVTVKVGDGPGFGTASLHTDQEVLRRGEAAQFTVRAYAEDGTTELDLDSAEILYHSSHPQYTEIDEQGTLIVTGIPVGGIDIEAWATVTIGNEAAITNRVSVFLSREGIDLYDQVLNDISAWMIEVQTEEGALAFDRQLAVIKPEAANIGARGLLLRSETAPLAIQYANWYKNHWNWPDASGVHGTQDVYEFNESDGIWVTIGYDSASPNIATFISLQRAIYEATGQWLLTAYELDVMTGGVGMMRMQGADGLMTLMPSDATRRLQDNALAYRGMADSVWLFLNVLDSEGPAAYFCSFAEQLRDGMAQTLWDDQSSAYYDSIAADDTPIIANWHHKAEAVRQLAPLYQIVIDADSSEAVTLYNRYNEMYPDWANNSQVAGTDAAIAYAAALIGDQPRVNAYLETLSEQLQAEVLPEGWNVEQAGYAMMAADEARKLQNDTGGDPDSGGATGHSSGPILPQEPEAGPGLDEEGRIMVGSSDRPTKIRAVVLYDLAREESSITIKHGSFEAEISMELVDQLILLLNEEERAEASIVFAVVPLEDESIEEMMLKAGAIEAADIQKAGGVYSFHLYIEGTNSNEKFPGLLEPPVQILLPVSETVDPALTGIYFIADDGVLEYVGGVVDGSRISVRASELGNYGVFQYVKTYKDVSERHWALKAIQSLAAKQIAAGINAEEFAPHQPVTRGEFVSLITRSLGLTATSEMIFIDVDRSDWFASAIAAAYEAGIVNGREAERFAPHDPVTREEMVVMVVRALQLHTGQSLERAKDLARFTDGDSISNWAVDAAHVAADLGLVQGRGTDHFVPQGQATRAESAQIIVRLLSFL